MRVKKSFQIKIDTDFKTRLLNWSQQFDHVVWLDSNKYDHRHASYSGILAVGANQILSVSHENGFDKLRSFYDNVNDWLFGYLSYDMKNDVEDLTSENFDGMQSPELVFFQPGKLFFINNDEFTVSYLESLADEIEEDLNAIDNMKLTHSKLDHDDIKIKLRIHKDAYFDKINTILEHIHRGDIYEANFCQEFYSENTSIDPLQTYLKLNAISKPPFASFLKNRDQYVMSASPERYLKKEGKIVISQPIKGTAGRSDNPDEDDRRKSQLEKDPKERSENIMIVDLVRNDLARTAIKGSVHVDEMCRVYTFDQVHQMISTIRSEIKSGIHPIDIIKTTFPMGSMTGAPKISAMKIIETLEESKRGLYSGAIGYITPEGNFDFNVVIRSILYDAAKHYVSYSVGGAITSKSDPLKEYEECLIKAKAMRTVLEG